MRVSVFVSLNILCFFLFFKKEKNGFCFLLQFKRGVSAASAQRENKNEPSLFSRPWLQTDTCSGSPRRRPPSHRFKAKDTAAHVQAPAAGREDNAERKRTVKLTREILRRATRIETCGNKKQKNRSLTLAWHPDICAFLLHPFPFFQSIVL